jgi:hypothetical protein
LNGKFEITARSTEKLKRFGGHPVSFSGNGPLRLMIFGLAHQNRFSDQDVLVDVDGNRKQRFTENRPNLILMKSSTV